MRCSAWLIVVSCVVGCQTLPATLATVATPPPALPQPVAIVKSLPSKHDLLALERRVGKSPGDLAARYDLAESYVAANRLEDARFHLELFAALAQDQGEEAWPHLIRAHGRLVDVAEATGDAFDEQVNRGIGLFWLAQLRRTEPEPNGEFSVASLLCRAAKELLAADKLEQDQARVHFYLGLTWDQLGQTGQARMALSMADRTSLLTRLTPWERRRLQTEQMARGYVEGMAK